MATLVLTTVGRLVGGPIGGAIGAVIGSRVDGALLGPKRRGPRLGDLSVQTSSYGSPLPKLFGTMRVAGTVIWATDLREDRHRSGGGKGRGATTTYSYSAAFAVALSGRTIRSVGRIWADGKLLRGAAGDWKSDVGAFRLHPGDEDQAGDPLIAAAEGIDAAPAHRGTAYVVFDGLQLADFGNRIPSLTFEVEADDGAVEVGAIIAALSDGAVGGAAGATVGGYAASGDSARGAIEALAAAFPMPVSDDGERLTICGDASAAIDEALLGASANATRESRLVRDRRAAGAIPDEIALSYYEPARDFQAGLQRARRDGVSRRSEAIELPAAIAAAAAKGTAEAALVRRWAARDAATARLPWRTMGLRAGTLVDLSGERWRIAGLTLEHMVVILTLEPEDPAIAAAGAEPGRATTEPDAPAGETRLHLLDLPAFDGGAYAAPRLWLAAAGTAPGWRRATASLTLDGGASWRTLGSTAPAAVIGAMTTIPATGPHELVDRAGTIDVTLLHDGMALPSGGDAALAEGRNLALVGDELIGFGEATQLDATHWRLSALLRGRFGTDWAMATHASGDPFVLIERDALLAIDLPLAALGATAEASALGLGDGGVPTSAATTVIGRSIRPPSPIAARCERLGDGTRRITWIRRGRTGWAWIDGTDAPLGEDYERYRLTLSGGTAARVVETVMPNFDYAPADQAADGLAGAAPLTIELVQLGTFGASLPPATFSFPA